MEVLEQVCQPNGEVIITNDGATILNKMNVTQPAAKMLVELAKAQARLAELFFDIFSAGVRLQLAGSLKLHYPGLHAMAC